MLDRGPLGSALGLTTSAFSTGLAAGLMAGAMGTGVETGLGSNWVANINRECHFCIKFHASSFLFVFKEITAVIQNL